MLPPISAGEPVLKILQSGGLLPTGSRVEVFRQIYWVFLILGTIVGIVVIAYMLWNAYKYRAGRDEEPKEEVDRPELGEIPTGGGGGRKLFLSFGLSALIVVSLIIWTYGTLLYVEDGPSQGQEAALEIDVTGFQFGWRFTYPNDYTTSGTLRIPADRTIRISVTSDDVFHNFAITDLRVKSDAIPGQETNTWFIAEETGTYQAKCYELCGAGHSYMNAEIIVMEPDAFQEWYQNTSAS
ncbi:MAG: cytochrome c oxidase subunit II [Halobacteriales archaeon]